MTTRSQDRKSTSRFDSTPIFILVLLLSLLLGLMISNDYVDTSYRTISFCIIVRVLLNLNTAGPP